METATEQIENNGYKVLLASTYARGVAKLRETGEQPKAFAGNILARVTAYESGDKDLFDTWLNSCTGIAHKAGTTEFSIIPECQNLITIPEDFTQYFLPVVYSTVNGVQLDSQKGIYNRPLRKGDILKHLGWLASVEDKHLLKAYRDIVFQELKKRYDKNAGMAFLVKQNTAEDQLRALLVHNLDGNSNAIGGYLDDGGSFLLGSPVGGRAAGAAQKNAGLTYRTSAKTPEQITEERIAEELAVFDGFIGIKNQPEYVGLKKQAIQRLKRLYHGK